MKETEEFEPLSKQDWRDWLEKNHNQKESVWLIFYKKKSPLHNLSWSDSVDEALCFGWIDSTKKTIDSEKYKQYFTKRKPKSNWSKVNKIKTLTAQGLMREAGENSIKIAQKNGSWNILDEVEALIIPDDLREELEKNKTATEFFENLSNSNKKNLLYWISSAKKEDTRKKESPGDF